MNGLMPLTTTSTELQRHYKRVVRLAKRTKQPITVLSQNKPTLLVMDPSVYQKEQKQLRGVWKPATFSEQDIDNVIAEWDKTVDDLAETL